MPTRINFEQQLNELKKSLEEMGSSVETSIDRLFDAMTEMNQEATEFVIKNERVINDMERAIEAQCLSLITRQQPIVGDLRLISSALKVVTDIERIGDHAVDIAELVSRWKDQNLVEYSPHISPMITACKEMVHDAVEAFANQDFEQANTVIKNDDIVDELFNKMKNDVVATLQQKSKVQDEVVGTVMKDKNNNLASPDVCVDIMMIAKYLEKVGDHAVNIAEWEIFRETGSIQNVRLL
ncbi:MAG: phosphate signaling complex protein PhoU [Lachnospiraceae bacterium]|nr:phosphate signaling complex protein PhoU [Lachnospiraceae bacterium]